MTCNGAFVTRSQGNRIKSFLMYGLSSEEGSNRPGSTNIIFYEGDDSDLGPCIAMLADDCTEGDGQLWITEDEGGGDATGGEPVQNMHDHRFVGYGQEALWRVRVNEGMQLVTGTDDDDGLEIHKCTAL